MTVGQEKSVDYVSFRAPVEFKDRCVACALSFSSLQGAKKHWTQDHPLLGPHPYVDRRKADFRRSKAVAIGLKTQIDPMPHKEHDLTLFERWNLLPSSLPNFYKGKNLLRAAQERHLGQNQTRFICTKLEESFRKKPWMQHFKADLFDAENADATISWTFDCDTAEGMTAQDVWDSLLYSSRPDIPTSCANKLCAAIEVKTSAKNGVKSCSYFANSNTQACGTPAHGDPFLTLAITPAGHITEMHHDGVWDCSMITQLSGDKVWLSWPPTDRNLQIAAGHNRISTSWVDRAIEELEDGEILHLQPGSKFMMQPGTLHAVLSLTPSVTMHYRVHNAQSLPELPTLIRWDISSTLDLMDDADALEDVLQEHIDLCQLWETARDIAWDTSVLTNLDAAVRTWKECEVDLLRKIGLQRSVAAEQLAESSRVGHRSTKTSGSAQRQQIRNSISLTQTGLPTAESGRSGSPCKKRKNGK